MAQMRIITLMDLGLTVINGFLIVAVIGYALVLWQQGAASIGTVAAASALVLAAERDDRLDHVVAVVAVPERRRDPRGHGDDRPADPAHRRGRRAASSASTRGEITLDRVSHHYGRGSGGLRAISLTIRPGEKVGLVGRSGAGKSTLVNLILRFFDTEGGAIRIDGQDVRSVTQDSLRAADRHGDAGSLAAAPLGARQHPLRPARGVARRRWSPPPAEPRRTTSSSASPT